MKTKLICGWAAILLAGTISAAAADDAKAPTARQRIALFDGKTLDGWEVLKCEAVVTNGNILIQGGNGLVQTRKKYGDFVLEYEWKSLKADQWDSGVYFRYDTVPPNKPWPARYQANLRKGEEGNVGGLKGATSQGLFKNGEWNSFKLTVRGTSAAMELNGQPAWKAEGLEGPQAGYVSLQCEVPGGGQCLFRNIYLTELK